VKLTGLLPASRQYVRTHQQAARYPTLSNAAEHLRAALDLREEIVEGRTPEELFQCGFVVYKSLLAFFSKFSIFVLRVLPTSKKNTTPARIGTNERPIS
jgi:hypothetical protein